MRVDGSDDGALVPEPGLPAPRPFSSLPPDQAARAFAFEDTDLPGVLNPFTRTQVLSAATYAILTDGARRPQRIAASRMFSFESLRTWEFPVQAPANELAPFLTSGPVSTGKVFGNGLKWRYRFKSSQTGEVSGLSPLPSEGWNLGMEVTPGSIDYVGETAFFSIPGRLVTTIEVGGMDYIQLFRNTSEQDGVFYLVDEKQLDFVGDTRNDVEFTDNVPDEDLILRETDGLLVSPAYFEGSLPAVVRSFLHPTGRVLYYGIVRAGPWRTGGPGSSITITNGSPYVTGISLPRGRIGQSLRLYEQSNGDPVPNGLAFRIVEEGELTGPSGGLPGISPLPGEIEGMDSEGRLGVGDWEVRDDRDSRIVWMSEPNQPTQIDLLKAFSVGFDADEDLFYIDNLFGVRVALTQRRIYRLENDVSEDPSVTVRVNVWAEEGSSGFWCNAVTPFGLVFVNSRGVRVFDGRSVSALGSSGPFADFLPGLQFRRVDRSLLSESLVFYDEEKHLLHFSYVPQDGNACTEELIFDPESGVWRGPWRRRLHVAGQLRAGTGERQVVYGDDLGNLLYDQAQTFDHLREATSTLPTEAHVNTLLSPLAFRSTGADFDPDGDGRIVGCPVLTEPLDAGDPWGFAWVADVVSGTDVYLDREPTAALRAGQRVLLGWIDWQATTSYIDAGTPVQVEKLRSLRLRWRLPTPVGDEELECDPFRILASKDGGDLEETATTLKQGSVPCSVFMDVRVDLSGRSYQIRMLGRSRQGVPEITQVVGDEDVRRGHRSGPGA